MQIFVLPFHNMLLASDESGTIGHKASRASIGAAAVAYLLVWYLMTGYYSWTIEGNHKDNLPNGYPDNYEAQPMIITIVANLTAKVPQVIMVTLLVTQSLLQLPYNNWIAVEQLVILWTEARHRTFSRRIEKIKQTRLRFVGLTDDKCDD
jgi:hypothetical protein